MEGEIQNTSVYVKLPLFLWRVFKPGPLGLTDNISSSLKDVVGNVFIKRRAEGLN